MCRHTKLEVIINDEQPLFQVLYCSRHDLFIDGFGKTVELPLKEMIKN